MNSYLFILCPPFSGSTLLWRLVSTSEAVSSLPSEGRNIPEVQEEMTKLWNSDVAYGWEEIKAVWDSYWDHERPVLVEKSPPNLFRACEIVKYFKPVHFLIMVRNPYAHCEGLMRHRGWDSVTAAQFSVRCLRQQADNAENLENNISFTYEDLCEAPESVCRRIQCFLPQLGALKHEEHFRIHSIDGVVERGIINLNSKNTNNLSRRDIDRIASTLKENSDVMHYWGYEYLDPPLLHDLRYVASRGNLLLSKILTRGRRVVDKINSRPAKDGA